jgi:hypothetical protein
MHVEQVLGDVAPAERCHCNQAPQLGEQQDGRNPRQRSAKS